MLPTLALVFFLPLMDVGWNVDTITSLSFVKMDTDSDGFISKSEMTDQWKSKYDATFRPLTKPEYESQVDTQPYDQKTKQLLKILFDKMDKDKNAVLDSSDPEKFCEEVDTDGDGRISHEEYKRYTKMQLHKVPILTLGIKIKMLTTESFKKMDTNGDGLVSKSEIKNTLFGNDDDTDKQITKEKFERLVDVENVDPQTKMMVKNYFDELDKDKNGILNGQDVDVLFDEADIDKDDQISDHEFKRYIAKQLSRVPMVLFGMNVKILTNQSFRKTDSNSDGVVTKPEMKEELQEQDQDKNGQVSRDEYERWVDGKHFDPTSRRIVKTNFDDIDRDKNGFLDVQDAIFDETDSDKDAQEKDVDRDSKVTRDEYRRSVDAKNLDSLTKSILKDHFDDMDKDKNGVLDSKDVDITLDQADTDKDGKISKNEYKRYISKQLGCVGVYSSGMGVDSITPLLAFRAMDSNRDGLVSKPEMESKLIDKDEDKNVGMTQDENDRWSEVQYLHPHTKTMFKNRLDSMEKNKYGTLERSDIDSLFDEADLNRDNLISETEFERYLQTKPEKFMRQGC